MKPDGIWGRISHLNRRTDSVADILHRVPLFADLSAKELRVLEEAVHRRSYHPGETVFVEGDPGAGMFVIESGRVDILMRHGTANPMLLAELESGDFFGEMALLQNTPRSATAIAREQSDLIGFFQPDFMEIHKLHPQTAARIALGLAQTLAERLRHTNTQLSEAAEHGGSHVPSRR